MSQDELRQQFVQVAGKIGAEVVEFAEIAGAIAYIAERAGGPLLLPPFASSQREGLGEKLRLAGCQVIEGDLRPQAASAAAGVTGANFALADTGSVVLESTAEAIRLATTLPERHFVLLDPATIVADGLAAVPILRRFHQLAPRNYLAYISGPSRTADIERVLTIGVHGPCELHILLVEGISGDFFEM